MEADPIPEVPSPFSNMPLDQIIDIEPSRAEESGYISSPVVPWAEYLPIPIRFRQMLVDSTKSPADGIGQASVERVWSFHQLGSDTNAWPLGPHPQRGFRFVRRSWVTLYNRFVVPSRPNQEP
jgi:hypothetical protein